MRGIQPQLCERDDGPGHDPYSDERRTRSERLIAPVQRDTSKAPTPIARHFCPNEPHCELTGHDVRICSRKESEGRTYDLLHKSASACFRKQPPACPRASPTATPAQLAASMYHLSDKPRPISSPSRRPSIAMLSTSRVELSVIPRSVNLMKPSLALPIHRDAIRCVAKSRRAFDARIFG